MKNVVIPFFDESKLYYTGEGTLFSVNKAEVVAGNYLTLQAKVDFKSVYQNQISDVELVFPIPDGMSFVDNSMMVGSQQSVYQQENGVVTVICWQGPFLCDSHQEWQLCSQCLREIQVW